MSKDIKNNFDRVYIEFLKTYKFEVKEQTFRSFTYNFESHILPYFKNKDITSITKVDLLNWKNFIYEKGFKKFI